ncbi:MAG: putative bifunctional diguanylate cyclase/phosphodiesterase [Acidimicrobiales bacterium]
MAGAAGAPLRREAVETGRHGDRTMVTEGVRRPPAAELTRWRDRCIRLISACPDAFFEVDAAGLIIEWNPQAEVLFGWSRDEVIGRSASETVLPPRLGWSPFGNRADADRIDVGDQRRHPFRLAHRAGRTIEARAMVFTTGYGVNRCVSGFVQTLEALDPPQALDPPDRLEPATAATDRRGDRLTGLPDRFQFIEALAASLAATGAPGSVAVALLDLDRFKVVNGSMGHDTGDLVLVSLAERLSGMAGHADLIARFGGDEFLAMFVDRTGNAHRRAVAFAERARAVIREPFQVAGNEVFLNASAGIALNTFGVDGAPELLANVEAAMYRAKRRGGEAVETFHEPMRIEAVDRMTTEHSLHRALDHHELTLHYQPVVEVGSTAAVGVEALIRWRHPHQGLVPANRFIPVAEESGLIMPIGAWVLHEACDQLRQWPGHKGRRLRGSMEVNLSARQVGDARIVATVEEVLSRTGLPAEHLTLEITESALMQDAGSALAVLRALKQIGVQLAIDDFGTGYSSLSYLQQFPVDILKVDRSFIEQLGINPQSEKIVSSVIDLAHALGLEVVAEGVETVEQLDILRSLRCDLAQGFLFSVPRPANEIAASFPMPISA